MKDYSYWEAKVKEDWSSAKDLLNNSKEYLEVTKQMRTQDDYSLAIAMICNTYVANGDSQSIEVLERVASIVDLIAAVTLAKAAQG